MDTQKLSFFLQADDDSEDDEDTTVALSGNWRYVRKSKTWSRIMADLAATAITTDSSTSPNARSSLGHGHGHGLGAGQLTGDSIDSLPSCEQSPPPTLDLILDPYISSEPSDSVHVMVAQAAANSRRHRSIDASSGRDPVSGQDIMADSSPPGIGPNLNQTDTLFGAAPRLQRSQSERIKDQTKALMRRVGLMRGVGIGGGDAGWRRRKSPAAAVAADRELVIGPPVLVEHHSASPPQMRMLRKEALVEPAAAVANGSTAANCHRRSRNEQNRCAALVTDRNMHRSVAADKRHGRIFLNESSSSELDKQEQLPMSMGVSVYEKETFLDRNSNIDRVFVPKLPQKGVGVTPRDAAIRTQVHYTPGRVAPAPSPVPAPATATATEQNGALLLFNPAFSARKSPSLHRRQSPSSLDEPLRIADSQNGTVLLRYFQVRAYSWQHCLPPFHR